jgi:hypothetical protein
MANIMSDDTNDNCAYLKDIEKQLDDALDRLKHKNRTPEEETQFKHLQNDKSKMQSFKKQVCKD